MTFIFNDLYILKNFHYINALLDRKVLIQQCAHFQESLSSGLVFGRLVGYNLLDLDIFCLRRMILYD